MGGEALMLIGVLLMIASAVGPLARHLQTRRMTRDARRAVTTLLNAGARYRMEYGHWPGAGNAAGRDVRFGVSGSPNRRLVNTRAASCFGTRRIGDRALPASTISANFWILGERPFRSSWMAT